MHGYRASPFIYYKFHLHGIFPKPLYFSYSSLYAKEHVHVYACLHMNYTDVASSSLEESILAITVSRFTNKNIF
jgi:hypothetical protein